MNHYYTNNENLEHHYETIDFTLRQMKMVFTTDNGVFSKKTVDFGTRVLLEAFDASQLPEGALLDVGCGYGPIGLTLAKTEERLVDMVDVNERALDLTRGNARLNHVTDEVHIFHSSVYEEVTKKDYAAIITNPPIRAGKEIVHQILSGAYEHLQTGGELWVVIQKKQGAPSAQKKMAEVFGQCEIVTKKKGYFILRSKKQ